MIKIHYAGQPGQGFGWGVANHYLRTEIARLTPLVDLPEKADVVVMPLANHDLDPATPARARINLAITFFESQLGERARENAHRYNAVFAGSSWCVARLAERDIHNASPLIQGVDKRVFQWAPPRPRDGHFRIFSGGKFEWRKGHDLVIAAFRRLIENHPTAHLVCAWHNPWPGLFATMADSPHIDTAANGGTQEQFFANLLLINGIPLHRFTILPHLTHGQLAAEMAATDCGLFPNRCEGGTNLVAMEYASIGRPIVANALTGHADIRNAITHKIFATEDSMGWAVQTIDEIHANLVIAASAEPTPILTAPVWEWSTAARKIVETAQAIDLQAWRWHHL